MSVSHSFQFQFPALFSGFFWSFWSLFLKLPSRYMKYKSEKCACRSNTAHTIMYFFFRHNAINLISAEPNEQSDHPGHSRRFN